MEDKKYEAPRIEDHGDLAEITAATFVGSVLDGDYQAGTPINGPILGDPGGSTP
jgi:hypothetical protein